MLVNIFWNVVLDVKSLPSNWSVRVCHQTGASASSPTAYRTRELQLVIIKFRDFVCIVLPCMRTDLPDLHYSSRELDKTKVHVPFSLIDLILANIL